MIDIPRNAGFAKDRSPEAEARGAARQDDLRNARKSAIDAVNDALEPAALVRVALDPAMVAISSAISLKRIADALELLGPDDSDVIPAIQDFDHAKAAAEIVDNATVQSIAGDMLNLEAGEIENLPADAAHEIAEKIRRLASAVLRKAK